MTTKAWCNLKILRLPLTLSMMPAFRFDKNRILKDITSMFHGAAMFGPEWTGIREVAVSLPPDGGSDGEYKPTIVAIVYSGMINGQPYEIDNVGNVYVGKSPYPLTTANGHQLSWDALTILWTKALWTYTWFVEPVVRPYKSHLVKLDMTPGIYNS